MCVSSQVGCALACAFCATGRLGLTRNLAAWEIVEQVRLVRARLPRGRVSGVVFQGMGEPLANLDAVLAAIAVLTEPCAQGIDARAITVCTAGLPSGIRRLAHEAPNVRLGLSLSSAIAAHRRRVMPIADRHDLDDVLAAVAEHARTTGHAPMWAVTLLDGRQRQRRRRARARRPRARVRRRDRPSPADLAARLQPDRRRRSVHALDPDAGVPGRARRRRPGVASALLRRQRRRRGMWPAREHVRVSQP